MRAFGIITFLILVNSGNVFADLSIRYDSIRNNQKIPFNSVLIKQDLVRINPSPKNQSSVMIDLQSGDIVQLHPQSRRYFKINAQTLNQYVSFYQNNKTMFQGLIDHGIQQLNPDKREQVQQMLDKYNRGVRSVDDIDISPTDKIDNVLGVDCSIIAISEQGKLQKEVCVGDYRQMGLKPEDRQSLEQLKKFVQQFKQNAPPQHRDLLAMVSEGIAQLNGIPLKVINYHANGKVRNIIQAGSISFRPIPEQAYRIPQNYQQQTVPLL